MEHIVLETPERRAIYEKDEQRDQLLTKCPASFGRYRSALSGDSASFP
jgi:hypothetical protein